MNRKRMAFLGFLLGIVGMGTSCAGDPASVGKTVNATRAYAENKAERAIDGDLTTGWVSSGAVSETFIPMLTVEFEKKVKVSSITIDDSFSAGRTKEVENYQTVSPSSKASAFKYTSIPSEGKTAVGIFNENESSGWMTDVAPTTEAPQAFYGEFRQGLQTEQLVLDNEEYGVAPVAFKLLVSESVVPDSDKLNPDYEGWTVMLDMTDNDDIYIKKTLESSMNIKSVLYVVYQQDSKKLGACLGGLYLQQKAEVLDTAHYPVAFDILYSEDGETYEIIEVRRNDSPVYTYVFEEEAEIKSIRYIPKEEYDGNKPSLGEIIIK